jgi:hypothetical protein
MFYLIGVMRKTGLKEQIAVIATDHNDGILQASTFADDVVVEREEQLGGNW